MSKTTYAHLLSSVSAVKAKEVEGDKNAERLEDEKPPANDQEDGKKSKKAKKAKAESEEEDEDEGKEDEKREDHEEEEETEKEDKEDKKGKKSKKASVDVSGAHLQAARLEERLRCATIFQSKAAAGKPDLAARFAFHTDLSAETAVMLMEGFQPEAPARRPSIDERMAKVPSANVGSDVIVTAKVEANGISEEAFAKLPSEQKALMIVNSMRSLQGEAPLTKLN